MVETDRGSLPYALVHGEPLVACAAWALGEAGVTVVALGTSWDELADHDGPLVLHDPLCPLTPPGFIADCVRRCAERGSIIVAVRPVTDTVKEISDGFVGATLDRTALLQVVSPLVLPATVVAALDGLPTTDFADLVAELAARFPVLTVVAPATARRVAGPDDLRLLEALAESSRTAQDLAPSRHELHRI